MSIAMWKLEKDLCRCCHAEGSFKNLSEPCFQLGQEEVYLDMLQECLDIKIIPITGELSDVTYTICESCIARLRDASNFKRQVMDCEERFKDMYSRNLIRGIGVKEEPIILSDSEDMKQELQSMDDDDDDDDAFLKFDDDTEGSELTVSDAPKPKSKSKPKTKTKEKQPAKKQGPKKVKEEPPVTEAAVSGEKKKGSEFQLDQSVYPFFKIIHVGDYKVYRCLKCRTTMTNVKRHILTKHTTSQCPYCEKTFKTANEKRLHILKTHNLEERLDTVNKKVIREKQHILKKRNLEKRRGPGNKKVIKEKQHVPKKHNSEERLDTGTKELINEKRKTGERGVFCDVCKKGYVSKSSLRLHMKAHRMVKCPDCPSEFPEKKLPFHRNDDHGVPMPTCGVCGYRNMKQHLVWEHQRMVHMEERTVPCALCDLKFFSENYLRRHLIKHRPEKIYECSFCHKKFPRKNTLNFHEKIHKGEKNKVCTICGERFVQKASLNYHMGKHHPEAC